MTEPAQKQRADGHHGPSEPLTLPADHRLGGPGRRALTAALALLAAVVVTLATLPLTSPAGAIDTGAIDTAAIDTGASNEGAIDTGGTASTGAAPPAQPALVLEDQTPWVQEGDVFAARLRLPAGHGDGDLELSLYPALDDPAQVATTAKGEELGRRLRRLPALAVDAAADTVAVRFGVGDASTGSSATGGASNATSSTTGGGAPASTLTRVDLDPGVYPLVADLTGRGLDDAVRLVTHVVVLAPAEARGRNVALVVPMGEGFTWSADGGLAVTGDPGQLATQTAPLRAHPDVPLSILPVPGTLAALQSTPAGSDSLAAIVALAQTSQVVNGPFSPLDAGAWVTAGLDQPLVDQFAAGQATLTQTLGGAPTGTTWVVSSTDNPSLLRWQAARGVRTFLVPDSESPPRTPFQIEQVDAPHVAVRLEPAFTPPEGEPREPTPADAYQLLARLAVPALGDAASAPGGARPPTPPVAVLVDDLRPAAAGFLDTLLEGLAEPGPLQPVTADRLHADVDRSTSGPPAHWSLPAPAPTDLDGLKADLQAAQTTIGSYRASVGIDDPLLATLQNALMSLGRPQADRASRSQTLRAVDALVRRELGAVVLDRDQPITVTGHRADLPLTIHNRGERNLVVSMSTTSSDLEVQGPTSRTLQLPAGANVDVLVPVKVNRSGDFRLDIEVRTADGRLELASRALTVRSTAISGVGVVLSLGALLFLFGWWGRHIRRTRRARRAPVSGSTGRAGPGPRPQPSPVGEPVP